MCSAKQKTSVSFGPWYSSRGLGGPFIVKTILAPKALHGSRDVVHRLTLKAQEFDQRKYGEQKNVREKKEEEEEENIDKKKHFF